MRWTAVILGCAIGCFSVRARAQSDFSQGGPDDFSSPAYQSSLDPAWGVSPSEPTARPRRMTFGGFDLGVPIMLNVDHDVIRPGADLHAQGGLDLGYVGFFLHGGWRWVPVDFGNSNDDKYDGEDGRDPLKNPYFGFGIRGQIPNRSRVLPYASVSFDFNFWHFNETSVQCGGYYYWWCTSYDNYRFTPGFTGRAGIAVHVARSLYIDLGMGVSMSFEGDFFDKNQTWIEPFLGIMQRI